MESASPLSPEALFQGARNAFAVEQFDTALELAQRAVQADPQDPRYPTLVGLVCTSVGRMGDAVAAYEQALLIDPGFSHAHYQLGALHAYEQRFESAIGCFQRAIAAERTHAPAFDGLTDALVALGRIDDAIDVCRQGLSIRSDLLDAHLRLATLLQKVGRLDEALASAHQALALNPSCVPANLLVGSTLTAHGQAAEAIDYLQRAARVEPDSFNAHFNLGAALHRLGRYDEARASFQIAVRLNPANAAAQHMLAALSGTASDSAPAQYVELLFDGYAASFDTHLVRELEYNMPERLVTLLAQLRTPAARQWDVLDLGCGTGLVGAEIAPYARTLVGVDLSTRMLEIAREGGLYNRLAQADLLTMLRAEPTASFDVVTAADVFIYVGRLEPIVAEIRRVLRPAGTAAFTFEALEDVAMEPSGDVAEFRLNPTGRYTHSSHYLQRLAHADSFAIERLLEAPVRREQGRLVPGWITVWRAPPATH